MGATTSNAASSDATLKIPSSNHVTLPISVPGVHGREPSSRRNLLLLVRNVASSSGDQQGTATDDGLG